MAQETLIGVRPGTQHIAARFLRPGDYMACPDLSFALVKVVAHLVEADTVMVTFLDGTTWMGADDAHLPIAMSRDEAAEWNRKRSELDIEQLVELYDNT